MNVMGDSLLMKHSKANNNCVIHSGVRGFGGEGGAGGGKWGWIVGLESKQIQQIKISRPPIASVVSGSQSTSVVSRLLSASAESGSLCASAYAVSGSLSASVVSESPPAFVLIE